MSFAAAADYGIRWADVQLSDLFSELSLTGGKYRGEWNVPYDNWAVPAIAAADQIGVLGPLVRLLPASVL